MAMPTEELSLGQVVAISSGLGGIEAKRRQGQNWVVDVRLETGELVEGVGGSERRLDGILRRLRAPVLCAAWSLLRLVRGG